MKSVMRLATGCLSLALLPGAQSGARRPEPFVPVGVSYRSELARNRERAAADLEAIQTLGFNSVRVPVEWAAAEPARGQYQFDALEQTLELASQAGLKVALRLDTASLPDWVLRRYPDGRFVSESETDGSRPARACLDHPGVRADVVAYLSAAATRAARHAAWYAIDLGSELPDGFCACPYTERRFREWQRATFGPDARPVALAASDRAAFVALARRDHLALLSSAASARESRFSISSASAPSIVRNLLGEPPGQDDWLMTTVVDLYGTLVPPDLSRVPSLTPAQLGFALDGIRSAVRDKGWLMTDGAPRGRAPDLRLTTWSAFSRGARGVTYDDWRRPGSGATSAGAPAVGLVGPDDTITDRARAAGGLARVIGRNPALFAPLRPRAAKVAIAYDPRLPAAGARSGFLPLSNVYQSLFERNIQVDFIHLDEIAAGMASRYNLVFADSLPTLPGPVAAALKAYAAAGGTLISGSTPETTDAQLVGILARAGVGPDVRIDGATGPVETRFLESADVLMLIGLNHADTPQRVKMTFTPDTQEAIWQNMETGSAVNFVAGPEGPTYTYSFGPRDALVLMIRKSVR
jgi:beta-galactosidase